MYALTNCTLYTGSCVLTGYGVLIEGDKIVAISHLAELPAGIEQIDLKGANLTAGFIDVQLNGCGGVMFNTEITVETLATMQAANLKSGTTSFLPTLITSPDADMKQAVAVTRDYMAANPNEVLGVHLEGPYTNLKRKGIHPAAQIRQPADEMIDFFCANADAITKITLGILSLLTAIVVIPVSVLATVVVMLAVPLGLGAARNLVRNSLIYNLAKEVTNLLRAVPELMFALVFVVAVGLGPFAGVLALACHTAGFLGKFYAEAIENIAPGPVEAVTATGARAVQRWRYAVWPQITPLFHSYNLYILDRNIRASTLMGIVGAGGIGFELVMSMKLFEYRQTAALVLLILGTILVFDWLSARLRARVV